MWIPRMNIGVFAHDRVEDRQAHGLLTTLVTLLCDNAPRYVCYLISDRDHGASEAVHPSQPERRAVRGRITRPSRSCPLNSDAPWDLLPPRRWWWGSLWARQFLCSPQK